jgi:hypothetical protein
MLHRDEASYLSLIRDIIMMGRAVLTPKCEKRILLASFKAAAGWTRLRPRSVGIGMAPF